ncbi:MAG TPA: DUF6009 family protein [Pirellulaceae bacterium]|jgi:hypothetical protein|nr:DUF6009 family protein [Pirellulaceae bacterium]
MTIKTQTVKRPNGCIEVMRVLSATSLTEWSDQDPLAYEKSILWLKNIDAVRFVRTVEVRCARSRRGALNLSTGERVIGYAKLTSNAPRDPNTDCYTRRLFYLKPSDTGEQLGVPPDAVDPRTILPGVRGETPIMPMGPLGHTAHDTLQPGI